MDGSDLEIIAKSRGGVADGVQNAYAGALKDAGAGNAKVPVSIGYQCPVYAPGMGPAPLSEGDTTINVGGPNRIRD
jgi:hypothetical protein